MRLLSELFGAEPAQINPHPRLAVLSQTYVSLTVESLRSTLDFLYPAQFPLSEITENKVRDGFFEGMLLIECVIPGAQGWYVVYSLSAVHAVPVDFAAYVEDDALRAVTEAQEFSLEVGLVSIHGVEEEAYNFIGKVLAALAPPDSAVLIHPSLYSVVPFTSDVRKRLASGNATFGNA